MPAVVALIIIARTLARYERWRDGCPDCGEEGAVVPWADANGNTLRCWRCNRVWVRGEA